MFLYNPDSSIIVVILLNFLIANVESNVPRPRGVSLAKASLYTPSKDFTCFDGTVSIPFSYVNDDYCDCFDGSDEPGTSACLNGVFHCTNAGFRPQNLPSSRVNDGVCDCCDGTDEYASSIKCSNICEELGKEAQAEAIRLADVLKAGSKLRQELIEKGNKHRNEMAEQLAQLEKDKAEAEKIKEEKEALKSDLEVKENEALRVYKEAEEREREQKAILEQNEARKEATEQFNKFDSNSDGHLSSDEITTRIIFDRNKDGVVDEEEASYFLGEDHNVDVESFISTTWPLIKPAIMLEQGHFKPPTEEDEVADEPEFDELGETEHTDNDDFNEESEDMGDENKTDDDEEHESPHSNKYDDETQKLVNAADEARRQFNDAERTTREIDSNIRSLKENLEKDYGTQQEYASLDGQCYEYEDKEYVYRLCLFQKVTQKSKNGGSEVGLGNWGEWSGEGNTLYSSMKYTNGMGCWNGPNRLTNVDISCGLDTQILSVTEPFRCEYKIQFTTPAACDDSNILQHSEHDEL